MTEQRVSRLREEIEIAGSPAAFPGVTEGRVAPEPHTHAMASTMASPMRIEQTAWSSR